uniref:CCDC50_N domain-containing protein n=1 Tax=Syphacia muris TaxID=451379 RepID=A0A0N5B0L7_9BILA
MDLSHACDTHEPFYSVTSRLRMFEDFNLASRLQDQEFDYHYALNRAERQLVGRDTKTSRKVQDDENRDASFRRQQELNKIAANDERLALHLQKEMDENEKREKEKITQLDAIFAKTLELSEKRQMEERIRSDIEAADAIYARELQNYYDTRFKRNKRRQEEASRRISLLPSFFAKPLMKQRQQNVSKFLRNNTFPGGNSSQRDRLRNESNYDWADNVDERTQNELNVQMASAAAKSADYNDPPPAYSSLDYSPSYVPDRNNPLATLVTRDSTSSTTAAGQPLSRDLNLGCGTGFSDRFFKQPFGNNDNFLGPSHNPVQQEQQHQKNQDNRNMFYNNPSLVASSGFNASSSNDTNITRLVNNNTKNSANNDYSFGNFSENQILAQFHPTNPFISDLVNAQSSCNASCEGALAFTHR